MISGVRSCFGSSLVHFNLSNHLRFNLLPVQSYWTRLPSLHQRNHHRQFCSTRAMQATNKPANASGGAAAPRKDGKPSMKEVKILMLHGYTSSGTKFRMKTRALEKLLVKMLAPFSLKPVLAYPTGPNRLQYSDVPGFVESSQQPGGAETEQDEDPDMWAWFRKNEGTGYYRYFDAGMDVIASAIREMGGIDGVIGFSQGGATAGFVAAGMESGSGNGQNLRSLPESESEGGAPWARKLREANGGKALSFAVIYSGFAAPWEALSWCYEPKLTTPTLHYIGSLDAIVTEERSRGLVERCEDPAVVVHPGGHIVPIQREWVVPLAGFIKKHCLDEKQARDDEGDSGAAARSEL